MPQSEELSPEQSLARQTSTDGLDAPRGATEASERSHEDSSLRGDETRYRSLFNAIDAGICVVDVQFTADGAPADYRLVDANRTFASCATMEAGKERRLPGRTRDRQQQWLDLVGRVARTGAAEQLEMPAPAPDGRWYVARAFRVDAPKQHPGQNHVAILFSDLTERRRTQEALERSREELEAAAAAADLGRYDYRPREGTLTWDDRCRALFGLSPGVPVTYESAFVAGLHPDDRERADQAVADALDPAGPGSEPCRT